MSRFYHDSFEDYYDPEEEERREQQRLEAQRQAYREMTPEELGKAWRRQCGRHDSAVDRCEEINSPTIEDAAGWMRFIEREFERRGLRYFDFTGD